MFSTIIENLPEILTAIGSIVALLLTYNQYTKNKLTDYKVEKWKNEERKADRSKLGIIATIYGQLWELLYALKSDRVFIIQPHPLYRATLLTATLEVKKYGVASAIDDFVNVRLDSIPQFSSRLANEDLIVIEDINNTDIEARVISAIINDGSKSVLIKRLADEKNNWVGNIIVGYSQPLKDACENLDEAKHLLDVSALSIEYVLPEHVTDELN